MGNCLTPQNDIAQQIALIPNIKPPFTLSQEFREQLAEAAPQVLFPAYFTPFYSYEGQWAHFKFQGAGRLCWLKLKTVYEGQFKEGRAHGKGKLSFSSDQFYQGSFCQNLYSGLGRYKSKAFQVQGEWLKGALIQGTQVSQNGDRYQGSFQNFMKHGSGKLIFSNGIQYQGQFARNLMEGEGRMKWPDGRLYVGGWLKSRFHGSATINGIDYEFSGCFKEGLKDGECRTRWKEGGVQVRRYQKGRAL